MSVRSFSLCLLSFLSIGLGSVAPSVQAQTYTKQVVNFNDLSATPIGLHVPAGYGGFNWGLQWYYMTSSSPDTQNYLAMGTIQAGTLIQRADRLPFYYDGAMFWSRRAADANGSFYYVLYLNGKTVFDGTQSSKGRMRFDGAPKLIRTGYKGLVDTVAFVFHKDDYDHVAADDFRFRVAAP